MKILKLTQKVAELQVLISELKIFEKSLMEAYHKFTIADFEERIRGLSKAESFELANVFRKIVESEKKSHIFKFKNQSIKAIHLVEDNFSIQLTYRLLLTLRSVLNELRYGSSFGKKFHSISGLDKNTVSYILDFIHFEVVEKMEENMLENIILKKAIEISNKFNLEYYDPLPQSVHKRIQKECNLYCVSHNIIFFLASLSNKKKFSGLQIAIGESKFKNISFAKSEIQAIRLSDLVRFLAYIELALTPEIKDKELKKFTFEVFNSQGIPSFTMKISSRQLKSENRGELKFCFRLYLKSQKDGADHGYFEIEDTSTISHICGFMSLIQAFLSELTKGGDR